MKRLLTTLIILLVVIVAGLTALVMLVNPNDFRGYIVKQVQKKSGYQLVLRDDLRWHVWPKLSILTGEISLTAENAKVPTIVAENMRLDVELLPLLSHQLSVKEVMLKGAVLRFTPDSQPQKQPEAPIAPESDMHYPGVTGSQAWKLDIARIRLVDSLLIWQTNAHDQLNVRDLNLLLERSDQDHVNLNLRSKINKNQQELSFELNSSVDISDYPQQLSADIHSFEYQLQGVGLPSAGIQGTGSSIVKYQAAPESIALQKIALTMNDGSELKGNITAVLQDKPQYAINLSSAKFNLDNLLGWDALPKNTPQAKHDYRIENNSLKPVIATSVSPLSNYDLSFLQGFNADISLAADKFIYQGMDIDHFGLQAINNSGLAKITKLSGNVFGGHFALPTSIDATVIPAKLHTKLLLQRIEIQPLLTALALPSIFSGQLNVDGDLLGEGYDEYAISHYWQGDLNIDLKNARLEGLNIPQLIQQSFARATDQVGQPTNTNDFTEAKNMSVKAQLEHGEVKISELVANSGIFNIKGQGKANLLKQNTDVSLWVQLTNGWGKQNEFVRRLAQLKIPLRVYGDWNNLQYALNVEPMLRDELQQKAKNWLENNSNNENIKALEDLLKKK
ncbi:outer membrane assembly protein AsmA [Xenorhabdus griffiniae]|uniref:Outer membrane assembly protein AsmA n=1 Tax=Xenorhabdus griffiniae TaxID=351672 RepID=A0ABY9XE14_9GAMM|nr:outer membrane assembly protein AsmA [Xenorhabdus griffiniae]MBD1226505.1 outer membrane assembly protein AsmA [Xenorhabdus griffiniae]MBE8586764.1 outer membrane assembly protein AsmA [Xenorhabdus griffiniae]WMV71096.1 outer membrane assembly protein AsmA [Xenorhabdus griffiniae]WNH00772.1 outer membrane assembly protein AsmA [Xenorhabdus griffiniae]